MLSSKGRVVSLAQFVDTETDLDKVLRNELAVEGERPHGIIGT